MLLAGAAAVAVFFRRTEAQLGLQERWAEPLARDVEIGGMEVGSGGRGLVWSPTGEFVVTGAGETPRRVRNRTLRPIGAALLEGSNDVEVFDRVLPGIVRLDALGAVRERRVIEGLAGAEFASRTPHGWYVVAPGRNGRYALFRIGRGKVPVRLFSFIDPLSAGSPRFRLSTTGDDALATELTAPYRVFRIDTAGRASQIARALHLAGDDRPTALDVPGAYWASLPVIAVGGHYLQTLVDVRSDRRVILVYDPGGSRVRARTLKARLTPVAASSSDHTLLALRQVDGNEVVGYHWSIHR